MSTVPSRDSAYRFPPLPAPAKLDREIWDRVLGDVDLRLDALESKRTELQDLLDDLSFNGQARIDAAISPLIVQVEADVVELRTAVTAAIAAAANAATEVTAEVRSRVATLEGKVAAVEAEFTRILANGLAAGKVSVAAISGFAPTNVQSALEALVTGKAPLASPTFTGNPQAPTPTAGDADKSLATTEFVQKEGVRIAYIHSRYFGA